MKKLFILFFSLVMGVYAFAIPGEIDQKFVKAFDSSFPNAQDVSWMDYEESYEVSFVQNGIRSRVFYPKDQSYVRLTRYFKEASLPYSVQVIIKKQFPEKNIYGVTEISTITDGWKHLSVAYHIILEDEDKWFTVIMEDDGNLSIGKKLKKKY